MDAHGKKSNMSNKKNRAPSAKAKKGIDESEKVVFGAGWTLAATTKFLECTTEDERIQHLYQMFNITDQDYKYDSKATTSIDFHLANGIYCIEKNLDAPKTQFVCRILHKLLEQAIQAASQEGFDIDSLRSELYEQFQAQFLEFNTPDYHFSVDETKDLVYLITHVFLRPLRLLLHPFTMERHPTYVLEMRKVSRPVKPVPLSECEEFHPVVDEEMEFPILSIPKNAINLEDVKQMIQDYTDNVISTIEKRYDLLDEQISHIAPIVTPQ